MLKTKTTRKNIKESYSTIISVGYCNLQNLLACESERYYCTRAEGWACDIYIFGDTAISTGYDSFGNIKPSYELQMKYDEAAKKIRSDYSIEWEDKEKLLKNLIADFIGNCLEEKKRESKR